MATRTISNAGGNWSALGTWVEGAVPIAGDAVVATGTSGNLTIDVPSACATLILSTYTDTLTWTSTLTVTSTVTFPSTMTHAGTAGSLILSTGGQTITSGGKTLTCALTFATNGVVYTLGDNWTVNGLVSTGGPSGTQTINGNQITCAGGVTGGAGNTTGTSKLVLSGGTWQSTGSFGNNVDLAGNVTVSGTVAWNGSAKTLRYISGTIITAGSTISNTASSTWDTNGMTFNNVTFGAGTTQTLSSNLGHSGTLTLSTSSAITITGAGQIIGPGALTLTGTGTLTLNNSGGISTSGTLTLPNTACTFAGTAGWTVGTLTTPSLTSSRTYTLKQGNTYTVTGTISNAGTTLAIREAIVSSVPGTRVVLNLQAGGTSDLLYCDPTDVDSSAGQFITTTRGVITNTLNWGTSVVAGGGGQILSSSIISPGRGLA